MAIFSFKGLQARMSCKPVPSKSTPTPEDDLIQGVKCLSDQIRSYRCGGLSTGTRRLSESNYDEDDVEEVDPSSEFGLDRFEKSEELASSISRRMARKRRRSYNRLKRISYAVC